MPSNKRNLPYMFRASRKSAPKKKITTVIRNVINKSSEVKYHDTELNASIDDAGIIYTLSDLSQGQTDLTRIGDQQNPLRFVWKGQIVAGDSTNVVRVMLIQNKSGELAHAASTDVTKILSSNYVGGVNAPYSPLHHDYRRQYTVLYNKTFYVDTYNPIRRVTINKDLSKRKLKVHYDNGGTTQVSGAYYLLMISDSSSISHPSFTGVGRLYYNDK